ncbi:SH3 domain-containing protein [Nitrosomonas sp.]|uniref:SH3 domain-containing protein n=1 Tax=Nitrosomonas sp. TaxID=42353 RepID=UPI0025EC66C4|nr:SH3 domain-containing protein [Nitrosomonas sp.]MCC6916574.1 SH3 domain-containing protein [Nitrosomonas sp.]
MPDFNHLTDKQFLAVVSVLMLASISLAGCVTDQQRKPLVSGQSASREPEAAKTNGTEVIPIPEKLPRQRIYRDEIIALKQKLAEKDELIRSLNAREQGQAQALQETASEISRTKSKLHRLATQPDAASKIAEVEVAISAAKQAGLNEADSVLQRLAQHLLNAATVAYQQKDYSTAMNYAAQSGELIDAIVNPARKSADAQDATVVFHVLIPVYMAHATYLQADPDSHSRAITLLEKNTPLTAVAYNGSWLRVQTGDALSGWIQSRSVDVRVNGVQQRGISNDR